MRIILMTTLLILIALPGFGQYDADRGIVFLEDAYSQKNKNLQEMLIREVQLFLRIFNDHAHAPRAQMVWGKLLEDRGDELAATAAFLKILYVYPLSAQGGDARDAIRRLMARERSLEEHRDWLEEKLNLPIAAGTTVENHYQYLGAIAEWKASRLRSWQIREFQDFIERYPDYPGNDQILVWIADVYRDDRKEDQAALSYRKLTQLYPRSSLVPQATFQQAELLSKSLKSHSQAIAAYQQLAEQYPQDEAAPSALFRIAEIREEEQKKYISAIDSYRQLIEMYPDNPLSAEALWRIGEINRKEIKRYDTAIETFQALVDAYPANARSVTALGQIAAIYQRRMKDYPAAAAAYARLAELYPEDPEAAEHLYEAAEIFEKDVKDVARAISHYEQVLIRYPKHRRARDAVKRIDKLEKERGSSVSPQG